MGILDFLKKDETPRAYRAVIQMVGVERVRETTINGARSFIIKEVKARKKGGRSTDPGLMIQDYQSNRDPGWDAMCRKVGITDSDIYQLMVEEVANYQESTTIVSTDKPGRNEPCPCGSGKKYKRCCGA